MDFAVRKGEDSMDESRTRIARYKRLSGSDGNRYQFFCEVSGALVCTTDRILLDTPEREVEFAWQSEGKKCFNRCQRCEKWVSDVAFNVETLECVECSPWEEEPAYCPHCGAKVSEEETFCPECGRRLRYGKEASSIGMKADSGLKTPGR